MVEVGVVIKWHTGTLKDKYSYPYIDVPSIDDKYVLAELSEIIPGKIGIDWDVVSKEELRSNSFIDASHFTQDYLADRAYARQRWQIAQVEKYS